MGRYVIDDQLVPIYEFEGEVFDEEGNRLEPNIIWIRPKMNYKARARAKSEVFAADESGTKIKPQVGNSELAFLWLNIVKWEGPDLSKYPCTREFIEEHIDPSEPHMQKVLDEITKRNQEAKSPDPKGATKNGSLRHGARNSEVRDVSPSDDWTRSSRSSNGGNGHPNNVTDLIPTTTQNL